MSALANAQSALMLTNVVATAILIAGVVDDLRSRKFHNWLFLVCAAVGFIAAVAQSGLPGLATAALGFGAGFAIMLPLVLFKIVGAGDLKLMAAFGAATSWNVVITVALIGLAWGAVFGVLRVITSGQSMAFARNMMLLVTVRKSEGLELHKIPYSVALLLGWFSALTIGGLS